jgi:tRNA(fMet)-specific endonuclease VapC
MWGLEPVLASMARVSPADVAVSAITVAELWFGARKSRTPRRARAEQDAFLAPLVILDFGKSAAEHYAVVREHLERRGTPIGERDLMIASIALANDRELVTNNLREFRRVPELVVVDWSRVTE